jgi:tol-pal system protein YbgF
MTRRRNLAACIVLVALGGCASKGDLRRVEEQLVLSRGENQRADSARAAQLGEILTLQRRVMDSLNRTVSQISSQLTEFKGDVANDMVSVQQQLVQIQALTGQSTARLEEFRTQLEARAEQISVATPATPPTTVAPAPGDTTNAPSTAAPSAASNASAEQMYSASLQQLRRGSPGTARMGFRALLQQYPTHARVADATYFLGETYAAEAPDSAISYYNKVVETYPQSTRAASSLYKLGILAERAKNIEGERGYYNRVLKDYPRSDEAALARDRLRTLGR